MKAYLTVGLPASGKSTWARGLAQEHNNIVIINNDTIRERIYTRDGHRNWSGAVESEVKKLRESAIRSAASLNQDVIVDNTHMNPHTLQSTIEFCKSMGFGVIVKDFRDVSVDECIRRDALRSGTAQVGEAVIRRMAKNFKNQSRRELPSWTPADHSGLNAIVVDIDGTVAEMSNRSPYDETRVDEDRPRLHVVTTVKALMEYVPNITLIFLSGRSEGARAATQTWLNTVCGFDKYPYLLWMRAQGDRRRDDEVKLDLFREHIENRYSIMAVFDDRAQVIRGTWKTLNLPVFRCGVIDEDDF